MRKLFKIVFIFMSMLLLIGCTNIHELSNDIETARNHDIVESQSIQLTETDNVLSEVTLDSIFEGYSLISRFDDRTFFYNKLLNNVDVLDDSLNLIDTWSLTENINMYNFEAISSDTIVFCSYYKVDDIQELRVYQLSKNSLEVIFDSNDVNNAQMGLIKELTKVNDSIYIIDSTNILKKIIDGRMEIIDTDGLAIDIFVDDKNYYILSEEMLCVYDLDDNLNNIYELNELTALEFVKANNNQFYIICMGKLLYTEDFENFKELEFDDHRFSYTYENATCLSSESFLVLDDDEMKQFNIYDKDELISIKQTVTIAINTLDTFLPAVLKKIKSTEFNLQVVYYDQLTAEEYSTKLSTELIAGSAPDLIITQGSDPIQDYVNNNAFYDLKRLIGKDSQFDLDLYEETLINASMIDNSLYTFPLDYFPNYICINKSLMDQLDIPLEAISSWEGIYETYNKINVDLESPDYFIGIYDEGFDNYFEYIYPITFSGDINSFVDFNKKVARFNSEEFLRLLPKMKSIYHAYTKSRLSFNEMVSEKDSHNNNADLEKHLLYVYNIQNGYHYTETYDHGELKLPMVYGFDNSQLYNENYFGSYVSINKDTADMDAAWAALKTIISYDSEWNYSFPGRHGGVMGYSNFGISKKSNQEKAENYLTYLDSEDYQKLLRLAKEKKLLRRNDINTEILPDEKVEIIENILRTNTKTVFKSSFDQIIIDELRRYFEGEISAKELSIILQNKTELYLGE